LVLTSIKGLFAFKGVDEQQFLFDDDVFLADQFLFDFRGEVLFLPP